VETKAYQAYALLIASLTPLSIASIHTFDMMQLNYNFPKGWSGFDSSRFQTVSKLAVVNSVWSLACSVKGYVLPLLSILFKTKMVSFSLFLSKGKGEGSEGFTIIESQA
jgi:hypothetical protein